MLEKFSTKLILAGVAVLLAGGGAAYLVFSGNTPDWVDGQRDSRDGGRHLATVDDEGMGHSDDSAEVTVPDVGSWIETIKDRNRGSGEETGAVGDEDTGDLVSIPDPDTDRPVDGVVVATGSNPIDTENMRVMTYDGEAVDTSASSSDPRSPRDSIWVDPDRLPGQMVRMRITPDRITPERLVAEPGQVIPLAVTSAGGETEILRFDSEKMQGVVVGVGPAKTRVIVFPAPDEPGEYPYYSSMSDHRSRGAEGILVVRD